MKKSILLFLFASLFFGQFSFAQNASSYYRKIASEQRKLRTKQINFYKTSLLNADKVRLDKSRDMIMTQLNSALRNMNRTPAYQGDSAIRNDYVRILEQYVTIYTTLYDSVQELKANATLSETDLKKYQEAFYYMEDMVDDAEDRWKSNEEYFTNAYNVNAMADPTFNQLNTLRQLAIYVEDMRTTYSKVVGKLEQIHVAMNAMQFENMEDKRQELALAAEEAIVEANTVGEYVWYNEDDQEQLDDFLLKAVVDYLDGIRSEADGNFANQLMLYEEARYDGNEKQESKSVERLKKLITDMKDDETRLNETIERFVTDYAEDQ